jgi:hypothetical protein
MRWALQQVPEIGERIAPNEALGGLIGSAAGAVVDQMWTKRGPDEGEAEILSL